MAGCRILAKALVAHACHWSSRSRAPTSGPVSGERFSTVTGLNRTDQFAHCVGQTGGLHLSRPEDKSVAGTVFNPDFLAGERGAAVIGKLAGELADGDLHD
jgi:hypothetical protein